MTAGARAGALGWLAYATAECALAAILPALLEDPSVHTPPNVGFTALLFLLYPLVGALGGAAVAVAMPLVGRVLGRTGAPRPATVEAAAGGVPLAAAFVAIFNPPAMDGTTAKFIYLLVSYLVLTTAMTVIGDPHIALGGDLSFDRNERTEIFGTGGGQQMGQDLDIPFLGEVPIDTRVRSGGDEGQPIVAAAPDAPAAQAFVGLSSRVAAQVSIQNTRVLRVIQTP